MRRVPVTILQLDTQQRVLYVCVCVCVCVVVIVIVVVVVKLHVTIKSIKNILGEFVSLAAIKHRSSYKVPDIFQILIKFGVL